MTKQKSRILLVGKFSADLGIYTYPSSFIGAFENAGCEVSTFNLDQQARPWVEKIISYLPHLGKKIAKKILNRALIKAVKKTKPSIVFIIKGKDIFSATAKKITHILPKPIIIHFYPDNPFCFWNDNSNTNVLATLPYIDLFLIWSRELIPILLSAGCRRVEYFPFAVDEKIYHPNIIVSADEYITLHSDVVFAGTWDQERELYLTHVANYLPNIKLAIWGNKWKENIAKNSPLASSIRGSAIYKDNLLKAFASSKIVLNFIRIQNLQAHNMRTIEALAASSFLLTQKTTEQCELPFIQGLNITCFSDPEDLIKKIAFYVNQDSLRNEVALAGHKLVRIFTLNTWVNSLLDMLSRAKHIGHNEEQAKNCNSFYS